MTPSALIETDAIPPTSQRKTAVSKSLTEGALCGIVCGLIGSAILYSPRSFPDAFIVPALVGAGVRMTKLRHLPVLLAGIFILGALIVDYTSMAENLMNTLYRTDTLKHADAIVVLSSVTQRDGSLSARAEDRAIHGYELLREGYADRLVLTDSTLDHGSQVAAIKRQMEILGLTYPVESAGPVADTHDEALAVARLVRERHWQTVILVTHPWHMLRASAVFENAGVTVICSPCIDRELDLNELYRPSSRDAAFKIWLHEAIGCFIYRHRGWIR